MLGNFIVETVNNPGVATLNLLGAATGRVTFSSIFSSGSQCYYYISDGTSFEYGIGTSTTGAPNTLSRDTVFGNSSGTTSKINFSGLCTVWNDLPAQARIGYSTRSRIDPTSGYLAILPPARLRRCLHRRGQCLPAPDRHRRLRPVGGLGNLGRRDRAAGYHWIDRLHLDQCRRQYVGLWYAIRAKYVGLWYAIRAKCDGLWYAIRAKCDGFKRGDNRLRGADL